MSLDFRQVQEQVRQLGETASGRKQKLEELRQQARDLLELHAGNLEGLSDKVERAAQVDPSLRCARPALPLPGQEPQTLNARFSCPALPADAILVAADGSQIGLDRHAEVEYSLINVGAIRMRLGDAQPPLTMVRSRLLYDEALYNPKSGSMISDEQLALRRDREERTVLAELVQPLPPGSLVVTLTDGPLELWGAKGSGEEAAEFQEQLKEYQAALISLYEQGAIAGGYVDKPAANLVVRLLEVAKIEENELGRIRQWHPLRGVRDLDLYYALLQPGERSAVFVMQSQSARQYSGRLALHFFYLNVGRAGKAYLARVEIPAWVAEDPPKLDALHAVLVDQCKMFGSRPYPYLLHRAHETAVVLMEERQQVTMMIALELRRRGVTVGDRSNKQSHKEAQGRTRYK